MTAIRQPTFSLIYEGRDITRDLDGMVHSVTYTDFLHGKSDTLSLKVEDRDGRWRGAWYPAKGDSISLAFGYAGEPLIDAGTYRLDEVEAAGPPSTMRLMGLAAAITQDLRTKRTRAFEAQTLADIADRIAADHGLARFGAVPAVRFDRVTQADETDVAFMTRLANQANLAFSIRDKTMVFHDQADLEGATPVTALALEDLTDWSLRDRTRDLYRQAQARYLDPATAALIAVTETAADVVNGDTLVIADRLETAAQAALRAGAELKKHNRLFTTGTLSTPGDPRLIAGNNVRLSGMGVLSGVYLIQKSTHTIDKDGGYKTKLEVRRVR